jgi:hypothetical protein
MNKLRYLVVLAVISTPVIFSWTLEVAFVSHEMQTMIFFVWPVPGVAAYHTTMYLLFVSCWTAAFILICDATK